MFSAGLVWQKLVVNATICIPFQLPILYWIGIPGSLSSHAALWAIAVKAAQRGVSRRLDWDRPLCYTSSYLCSLLRVLRGFFVILQPVRHRALIPQRAVQTFSVIEYLHIIENILFYCLHCSIIFPGNILFFHACEEAFHAHGITLPTDINPYRSKSGALVSIIHKHMFENYFFACFDRKRAEKLVKKIEKMGLQFYVKPGILEEQSGAKWKKNEQMGKRCAACTENIVIRSIPRAVCLSPPSCATSWGRPST